MQLTFWQKNKVFILGLLSAIAVALTPFAQDAGQTEAIKWATVGYAALIAILSYLASKWRGQGLSLIGIIGNAAGVISTLLLSGSHLGSSNFIIQLVLQLILSILAAAGADPKGRSYESQPAIKNAKLSAELESPAPLINAGIKKEAKEIKDNQ